MVDEEGVRRLFAALATGDQAGFFARVADDVDWTVMGTHPLAGRYRSKQGFVDATFGELNPRLREGVLLEVVDVLVDAAGSRASVELRATSTQNNGSPFDNRYCWVCRFDPDGSIVEVRAYLDSALVASTIEDNPV